MPTLNVVVFTAGFLEEGPKVVPWVQVLDTHSVKGCSGSEPLCWRRWNIGSISLTGRKDSAIIFLTKE